MDSVHRRVLDQHRKALVQDVILTDDFRAELRVTDLFTEGMLDMIMAERTRGERVLKMLELLPTRGPTAFDTFMSILEKDYPWLRTGIQADVEKELTHQRTQGHDPADQDHGVRHRASSFLHKRFGQSRKISEKDKRAIEKWLTDCIQEERTQWKQKMEYQARNNAKSTEKGMEDMSSRIEILNLKLEMCLFDSAEEGEDEETALKTKLHRHLKTEDAILYLDQNINTVREKLRAMNTDREKCLGITSKEINSDEGCASNKPLSTSSSGASLYKEVAKMKKCYEKKIREILEEKDLVITHLKEQIDELMAENLELIETSNKQMDQLGGYQKEMYRLQMQNSKLEERLERQEAVLKDQARTIENLKAVSTGAQKNKDKPFGNQSNWQMVRAAHQRPSLASQRTKRRILSKVNSTYLNEPSKPQNKTTKKE